MTIEDFTAERISDRLAIQDLMGRWSRAVDRLDLDRVADFFWPDATDDHIVFKGDIQGLVEWIRERHKAIEFSSHLIANMVIEFATTKSVLAETYVFTTQRYRLGTADKIPVSGVMPDFAPDSRIDSFAHARYVDRFEKRDGVWRIAKRTSVFDWIHLLEVESGRFLLKPEWNPGRRDRDDPLFAERRAMGLDRVDEPGRV